MTFGILFCHVNEIENGERSHKFCVNNVEGGRQTNGWKTRITSATLSWDDEVSSLIIGRGVHHNREMSARDDLFVH